LGINDIVEPLAEYIALKITEIKTMEEMNEFFGYEIEKEMIEKFEKWKLENEEVKHQHEQKENEKVEKMKKEEKRLETKKYRAEVLKNDDAVSDYEINNIYEEEQ
jgi:hypothetical protein